MSPQVKATPYVSPFETSMGSFASIARRGRQNRKTKTPIGSDAKEMDRIQESCQ
jgi:hypothetical protein